MRDEELLTMSPEEVIKELKTRIEKAMALPMGMPGLPQSAIEANWQWHQVRFDQGKCWFCDCDNSVKTMIKHPRVSFFLCQKHSQEWFERLTGERSKEP